MKSWFALVRDRRGTAAAEMALVTPLLLIIMAGSVELGNYFYNQHTLVKSVRDAARFAARQRMSNYTTCPGSPPQAIIDDTKTVARKGYLDSTANDLLPNWASATFSVTMTCKANLTDSGGGTLAFGGIYADTASGAPTVLISASLPYRPVIGAAFGFSGSNLTLNANQQAAVMGL